MTSTSKQDLTTSTDTLSIDDVTVSAKDYKRRKSLSHALIAGLAVAVCICIILVIALVLVVIEKNKDDKGDDKTTPSPPPKVKGPCLTTECVRAASYLSQSLDETVDPCDDLHKFTCGNWKRRHVLAEDQAQFSTFHELNDDLSIKLKNILELDGGNNEIDAIKKAKIMFKSCIDAAEIEKIGLSKVTKLIEDLGGWPVLGGKPGGKWVEGKQSLQEQLTAIRRFSNSPPIIDMFILDDSKDINKRVTYIDQPALGMANREYFLKGRDDKTLKAYENYAMEVAKIFGADAGVAANDTAEMINFEIQIANMTAPAVSRLDPNKLYNRMNISQLHQNYPEFNWTAYFTTVFGVDEVQITVTDSEPVIVRNPDYMDKIFKYIKTVPKRVVSNYITWILLQSVVDALPEKIRDADQAYRQVLEGTKYPQPRWKSCVSSSNDRLGLAVGRLFVSKYFDPGAKKKALEMITNLQFSMKNLIRNNNWMEESTKTVAVEKVDFMEPRIGYFDAILNDTYLNNRYGKYNVQDMEYFLNVIDYLKNSAAENLRNLRKPVDRTTWDLPPAMINAFHDPSKNQILFPAGILQVPLYHKDYPQYLNYGGIGYVIGHEITHGFDNRGRLYDKRGELKSWWTQKSVDAFKAKSQCVVDEYNKFVVPEVNKTFMPFLGEESPKDHDLFRKIEHMQVVYGFMVYDNNVTTSLAHGDGKVRTELNGQLTLGENIADLGGLKESFYAYKKWVNENGEEAKLPGLKYTPYQLFFINAAHVWCDNIRPAEALQRIYGDTHSNGRSRVIGPAKNFDEFSKAFNCPTNSYMNPAKKCVVW